MRIQHIVQSNLPLMLLYLGERMRTKSRLDGFEENENTNNSQQYADDTKWQEG